MTALIFVGLFILPMVIMAIAAFIAVNREEKRFDNGITVSAVVTENTEYHSMKRNTITTITTVQYFGSDGLEHESKLWHSPGIAVGTEVKIRYIPGEYDEVLLVSNH